MLPLSKKNMKSKLSKGRFARVCFFAIFAVLLLSFLLPVMFGIVHTGNVAGTVACVIILSIFLFPKAFSRLIDFMWNKKPMRVLAIILYAFISLGIMLALFISSNIVYASEFNRADGSESAVVVLGCKVNGTRPSLMLQKRIEAAYRYHVLHPDVTIIVSGGQGADEGISEAQCIKNELVNMGVPSTLIIMEDRSTSTRENLSYTRDILSAGNVEMKIAIVTDGFHQYRAKLIATELGISSASVPSRTPLYLLPSYFLREWFGVVDWYVFG